MLHGAIESPTSVTTAQQFSTSRRQQSAQADLAKRAYVVMPWEPDGCQLRLIVRGDTGSFMPGRWCPNSSAKARAATLNRKLGVSAAAASVLFIDWECSFKNAPIDPADYAAYKSDCRLEHKAKRGSPSSQAATGGYLRILTGTHNLPANDQICADSIRYIWLMAHFEPDWAQRHGRTKVRDMLKTERAAHRLSNCARALSACSGGYTTRYSRFYQVFMDQHSNPDVAASIAARRNDPERRTMLLEVRAKRRGAFKALFAAIRSYKRARSAFADA